MSEQDLERTKNLIIHTVTPDALEVLELVILGATTDGAHHKQWALDQIARKLAGPYYDRLIADLELSHDEMFGWGIGNPP